MTDYTEVIADLRGLHEWAGPIDEPSTFSMAVDAIEQLQADAEMWRKIAQEMATTLLAAGHDPLAQGAPVGLSHWHTAITRRGQP